ncbi:MAG: recombination mediator RecR [Treponemataceae bacterium]|nr:recombination protein RecR [Treponema sp.]MDE7292115.1 recombination mediator RecR [Treponemataceae bacterium]
MNAIEELVESFSRLPGIGKKSAGRITNFLLKADRNYVERFGAQMISLQEKIHPCPICGNWTEKDPCPICSDNLRDQSVICVVEQPQDVSTIESFHEFNGLFHVLGGVICPVEGIGPDELNIAPLVRRAKESGVQEIIIATNPTVDGDVTALYLQRILSQQVSAKITRLASGLPVGGDLEYADRLTFARSFRGRTEI